MMDGETTRSIDVVYLESVKIGMSLMTLCVLRGRPDNSGCSEYQIDSRWANGLLNSILLVKYESMQKV